MGEIRWRTIAAFGLTVVGLLLITVDVRAAIIVFILAGVWQIANLRSEEGDEQD